MACIQQGHPCTGLHLGSMALSRDIIGFVQQGDTVVVRIDMLYNTSTCMSTILAWLRGKSGSLWPCAICHASHNLFIQAVFTPITTVYGPKTLYAIDEFGFMIPLVIWVSTICVKTHLQSCALLLVLAERTQEGTYLIVF